ncbi:MAG: hypothetical protein O3C10_05815 [Chloroflexi bacterium]|nr:hypothetical protein [Chloroflexota bacterium]
MDAALEFIDGDMVKERYFFDHLTTPDWIGPLLEAGQLQHPPEPGATTTDIGELWWPASRYLERVATIAPGQVAEVITTHLAHTRNPLVRADAVSAALKMPAPIAGRLANLVSRWVREDASWRLPNLASELVTHLAETETNAALTTFTAIFGIEAPAHEPVAAKASENKQPAAGPISNLTSEPRAVAALGASEYAHLFERCAPGLIEWAPTRVSNLLIEWLSNLIPWGHHNAGTGWDSSEFWRSHLDRDEGSSSEPRGTLVTGLRSALLKLVNQDPASTDQLVQSLNAHRWTIFNRLALDLARAVAEERPDVAGSLLLEATRIDNAGSDREFTLLARDSFRFLNEDDKSAYLDWARSGLDEDEARELLAVWGRDAPTAAEIERRRQREIRDRLAPVSEWLPEDLKNQYAELVDILGERPPIRTPVETRSWVGEQSPKELEELRDMSIADLAEYLKTYEPPHDRGRWPPAPTVGGLRGVVEQTVRGNPGRYSRGALGFLGTPWPYLASVVTALRNAVEAEEQVDWSGALTISEELLNQSYTTDEAVSRLSPAEARRYVAQLINQGLRAGKSSIPTKLADRTFALVETLLEDPDPTVDGEEQLVRYEYAPFTMSLNTVRGEATHAACRYAGWRARGIRQETNEPVRDAVSGLPELTAALDRRLDPAIETSRGVQAALGSWFGALFAIDRDWAGARANLFFPASPIESTAAAFNAHLTFGARISKLVFDALREQYRAAVARVPETPVAEDSFGRDNPVVRLGEHLTVMFWQGELDLEPPDELLSRYFANAQPATRRDVLEFVGRSVTRSSDAVPADPLSRIQALWEWRVRSLRPRRRQNSEPWQRGCPPSGCLATGACSNLPWLPSSPRPPSTNHSRRSWNGLPRLEARILVARSRYFNGSSRANMSIGIFTRVATRS